MKINNLKLAIVFSLFSIGVAVAQRDSVYVTSPDGSNSVVRGKIVASSVFKVTVDTEAGKKEVPCSEIRKISFAGEPRGLDRARDHFDSQRYDDCFDAIKKIDDPPESKFMLQEYRFLESYASGQKAMRGDPAISTAAAEQILGRFIRENSDCFRLVRAVDLYAQLLLANGKSQQAQKEYTKLTKSRWPEFMSRGYFFEGEMLQYQGDLAGAKRSFQKLIDAGGTDAKTEEFKQLAACQLVKLSGLEGDVDSAIRALEKMIQEESSENTRLFAYVYNALGNCYLKSNELKKASRAFLHTELLFSEESDAHAEALYHLAKIWPQLKETERANRARSLLTSRYRNSIWASKL